MLIEHTPRFRLGQELLPFEMGYLPPLFQRKAEVELHESPENIEESLRLMREMTGNDKNFKGLSFDDDIFLQYLRGRKFNVPEAFSQLIAFANLRVKHIKMFTNIKFDSVSVAVKQKIVTFLPWRCPEGCAILLVEPDNWNPEEFSVQEVKRMALVFLTQSLHDPMTQVNGYKVIFNVKSNPMRLLRYVTPSNLSLLYHGTQECFGGRFKGIHLVNQSLALKVAWILLKPFMSDKFEKRVTFHSGPETLIDYFPKAVLPLEYGGDLEHHDMTEWVRKITKPENLVKLSGQSYPYPDSS